MTNRSKYLLVIMLAAAFILWKWRVQCALTARLLLGGAIIAFLLSPLCGFLEKKLRISRTLSVIVSYLGVLIAVSSLFFFFMPSIISQIRELLDALPRLIDELRVKAESVYARLSSSGLNLPEIGGNLLPKLSLFDGTTALAGQMASSVGEFALMLTLGFYFIRDRQRLALRLELLIPSKWRRTVLKTAAAIRLEMGTYLRCQALISLIVGALSAAALTVCGLQSALALGLIVGLFNLIPYFGPVLGAIPALLVALGSGWHMALFALLALLIVQQIDNIIVSPRVMSSACGLHPAVVLLAISIGGSLSGIAGMLFSVPIVLIFRSIARNWPFQDKNV